MVVVVQYQYSNSSIVGGIVGVVWQQWYSISIVIVGGIVVGIVSQQWYSVSIVVVQYLLFDESKTKHSLQLWDSKLNPTLSQADQFDVVKVCTDAVYPLAQGNFSPENRKKDSGLIVKQFMCTILLY